MTRKAIYLGAALAFGLATAAGAAVTPVLSSKAGSNVITVAEGCGPGMVARPGRPLPSDVQRARLSSGISPRPEPPPVPPELNAIIAAG